NRAPGLGFFISAFSIVCVDSKHWSQSARVLRIGVIPPALPAQVVKAARPLKELHMTDKPRLTSVAGAPVAENQNSMTAGARGPMLLQDVWFLEKLAHFDREVIPERRMHAKGSGAFGEFVVTHDITRYTKAAIFSEVGKKTPMFAR